jgi:hypothetical protein
MLRETGNRIELPAVVGQGMRGSVQFLVEDYA